MNKEQLEARIAGLVKVNQDILKQITTSQDQIKINSGAIQMCQEMLKYFESEPTKETLTTESPKQEETKIGKGRRKGISKK